MPPSDYLKDCTIPYAGDGQLTNADVLRLAIDREYALKLCNVDKRALRAWYEGYCAASKATCKLSK